MRVLWSFIILTVFLAIPQAAVTEDSVYNKIGIVKGRVFVINNPKLGRTPASGHYFVFQRMDCSRCLIGVRADLEGRYEASLGVGRYRVISTDIKSDTDLIRKGQVREIIVNPEPKNAELDIELEIPKVR
jgi:hypothetical protein